MTGLPFLYGGDTIEKYNKEVLQARIKAERAILKDIEEQYKGALTEINLHIAQLLGRQDADLPHVIHRVEYQRMLKQQVQSSLDKLHSTEYESVTEYLNESYTDAFVGTMYTLHHQDMPVILPISQALAVKAITLDTKLKKTMYEEMGKDISKLNKTIRAEITRGIASGMMYSEIARNISNQAGIPMRRAKTIARTEGGRVQEQASFDAAQQATESGADLVKQWAARNTSRTRDAHRMLHNQVRELNEYFEVEGHKALMPHGFGVARLDCNCECTVLYIARVALDADMLRQMKEYAKANGLLVKDSKEFGHAQAKNIAEFKKRYLKATENPANTTKPLINQGSGGIMEVELDGLVPCLKDAKTGELFDTAVHKITSRSALKQYNEKNGWFINWNEVPSDRTVCALTLKNDDTTQGLVAYKMDQANKAVYAHWLVSAPHNRGKDKQFTGVGGHLFAIMADASMKAGYDGYIFGKATSMEVLKYYCDEYKAIPIGGYRFMINEAAAKRILSIYNFERED